MCANPRKAIGHSDAKELRKTYKHNGAIVYSKDEANGSVSVGLAVTGFGMADDTVTLTGADEPVLGKLLKVESDGFCVVAISGELSFPAGDSATVTVGSQIVGALGVSSAEGYIKTVGAPTTGDPTLAQLNALAAARGRIINNDDLANVWVDLRV